MEQGGTTLIEVLVAITVLSFGLLAMLGMLLNGLKMTSSSHYRTIATQQLSAMADTLIVNPDLIGSYSPPASSSITAACLTSVGCSASELPTTDYGLWLQRLGNLLPSGSGTVCLDATPGDGNSADWACLGPGRPTVKVCWNESARIAISGGGTSGTDASTESCISTQL